MRSIIIILFIFLVAPFTALAENSTKNNWQFVYPSEAKTISLPFANTVGGVTQTVFSTSTQPITILSYYVSTDGNKVSVTSGTSTLFQIYSSGSEFQMISPTVVANKAVILSKNLASDNCFLNIVYLPYDSSAVTSTPSQIFGTTSISNLSNIPTTSINVEPTNINPIIYGVSIIVFLLAMYILLFTLNKKND